MFKVHFLGSNRQVLAEQIGEGPVFYYKTGMGLDAAACGYEAWDEQRGLHWEARRTEAAMFGGVYRLNFGDDWLAVSARAIAEAADWDSIFTPAAPATPQLVKNA